MLEKKEKHKRRKVKGRRKRKEVRKRADELRVG